MVMKPPKKRKLEETSSSRNQSSTFPQRLGSESYPCDTVPQVVTLVNRTEALLRGMSLIFEEHKMPSPVISLLHSQVAEYLNDSENESVWLKRSKDLLSYPNSLYLKNSLPEMPDRRFTPKGHLRSWWKSRRKFCPSNTHLWNSFLQDKRCSLPVSEDIVESTYLKHQKLLTSEDTGNDDVISEIFEQPAFLYVLRKVSDDLMKVNWSEQLDQFPSQNACFSHSRSTGGQLEALRVLTGLSTDEEMINNVLEHFPHFLCPKEPELVKMEWFPYSYSHGGQVVKSTYEPQGREYWKSLLKFPTSRPEAIIQAVLEPMKVRVISKGPALSYYRMKILQKAMHSSLKELLPFRLIGRPFVEGDLFDLRKNASMNDQWFSIDYSSATDNLSWKYSSKILEAICSEIPDTHYQEALQVLGPHSLYYPQKTKRGWRVDQNSYKGEMKRGQLMGSILSFPILCLANFGLYTLVNKERFNFWSIKEQLDHVLVNGDDMLYAAPDELWDRHVSLGRDIGLEMSVGKAYKHPIYCNINSIALHSDLTRDCLPKRIDFLNVGLFFGQHKVQGKSNEEIENSYVGSIPEILKGTNRPSFLLSRYLKLHSDVIKKETKFFFRDRSGRRLVGYRNLFLPCSLGGMGILPPPQFRFRISKLDRLLACALYSKDLRPIASQFPLPGPQTNVHLIVPAVPWVSPSNTTCEDLMDIQTSENYLTIKKKFSLLRSCPYRFSFNRNHVA